MQRRGFMKLIGAANASVVATRALPSGVLVFDEPLVEVWDQKDWIIDRGDYYLVTIPSEKILRGERFDKPVLAVFGVRSIMERCDIRGFMNIAASDQWAFRDSQVNASGYASTTGDRPAIRICDGVTGGLLEGLYLTGA